MIKVCSTEKKEERMMDAQLAVVELEKLHTVRKRNSREICPINFASS